MEAVLMPSNLELDLDAIKRDLAKLDSEETLSYMAIMSRIVAAAPALIAEVERLRQESADFEAVCMSQEGQIARLMAELATAKKIGAAEWQPIETAPKDETKILAINNRGNQCVCLWQNSAWVSMFSSGPSSFINGGCGSVLTHWMPLPEPPAELRAEVGE
jgi:hypothetical protein